MMKPSSRLLRLLAAFLGLALVAAACNSDDDDVSSDDDGGEQPDDGGGEGDGDAIDLGGGAMLDLSECPSDWEDGAGVSDDTITLAMSLPQSGALAAFGAIGEGMNIYFDQMEPIDGKTVELITQDDAYDAARTSTNVEEIAQTENPLAFVYLIGSPNNAAVRDFTDEECIPQLFNSTGLPAWGDPETYPWTIGGLLAYSTEARIWCENIAEELGEGATVAGVFMNNDFGKSYQDEVQSCADDGLIDLVENVVHDPAAPDITNEMTTAINSDADALIFGSTAAFCPQAAVAVGGSDWDPRFYMSNTCSNTAAFLDPTEGAADGILMASNVKNFTDPAYEDDPAVQEGNQILEDAGRSATEGSLSTGILFAKNVEQLLRDTLEREGEITRSNVMKTVWSWDYCSELVLEGICSISDGANDAYLVEGARIEQYEYDADAGVGSFSPVSDLIDVEGQTGSVTQPGS